MRQGSGRRKLVAGAVLDVAVVLLFVVIGRASHVRGESLPGVASTAWPFLCGLAVGWAAGWAAAGAIGRTRWRAAGDRAAADRTGGGWALAVWPAGVAVWLGTVALGMIARVAAGQGTAAAFIVVALAFLGLFLLGWRLVWALAARRWRPHREIAAGRSGDA